MEAAVMSVPMLKPQVLKEFRQKSETVRLCMPAMIKYYRAEDELARVQEDLRHSKQAARNGSEALKWIFDSESWRDSHNSWEECCKALKCPVSLARRVISEYADSPIFDLTTKEYEGDTEAGPQDPNGAMARLQNHLSIAAATAPAPAVVDDEMPKLATRESQLKTVSRHLEGLQDIFAELGFDEDELADFTKASHAMLELVERRSGRVPTDKSTFAPMVKRHVLILKNLFQSNGLSSALKPLMDGEAIIKQAESPNAGAA